MNKNIVFFLNPLDSLYFSERGAPVRFTFFLFITAIVMADMMQPLEFTSIVP